MSHDEFLATGGVSYSDWFGRGNTLEDYRTFNEEAETILISQSMVLATFKTFVACFGYDGNEYTHTFVFDKK